MRVRVAGWLPPLRRQQIVGSLGFIATFILTGTFVGQCALQSVDIGPEVELAYHFNRASRTRDTRQRRRSPSRPTLSGPVGLDRVIGVVVLENLGSSRVMEKAGMRFDGFASYHGLTGLKKYVTERDEWEIAGSNNAAAKRGIIAAK